MKTPNVDDIRSPSVRPERRATTPPAAFTRTDSRRHFRYSVLLTGHDGVARQCETSRNRRVFDEEGTRAVSVRRFFVLVRSATAPVSVPKTGARVIRVSARSVRGLGRIR